MLQSCHGIHNIIYPLVEVIFPNITEMYPTTYKVTTSLLKTTYGHVAKVNLATNTLSCHCNNYK